MEQTKYDVFISYSRKDYVDDQKNVIPGNEVSKIKNALTEAGISYWFDEEGIYSGQNFVEKIVTNIENAKVFLFLSTANANKSPWTCKEIASADEFKKHIIPVRIDSTPYNKKVLFRIADLDYIEYYTNPQKGMEDLIKSIKAYLDELANSERIKKESEERKKEELPTKNMACLKLKADMDCIFYLDGEERSHLKAGIIQKIQLAKGEYELLFVSEENDHDHLELVFVMPDIDKLQKVNLGEIRGVRLLKEAESKRIAEDKRQAEEKKRKEEAERAQERTFTVGGVSFKMIRVEGGSFMMGPPIGDFYNYDGTQHRVTLSDYYLGETPVTQALWKAVMGDNPSYWKGDSLPVERVSWNDCQEFIKQLNKITGESFRLPTEAEWEYAARGGRNSHGFKFAGSNNLDSVAWYNENSGDKTHPVKHNGANELGLYDMSGNVLEWCQDWYGLYDNSAQTNPSGPTSGSDRVFRGGSWFSRAEDCRVARRNHNSPGDRLGRSGCRLALAIKIGQFDTSF